MEVKSIRARQRDETRQRILLAACRSFGQKGISASSTQEIAALAAVSHGSVFVHFGSRDALIAAVVEEVVVAAVNVVRHELKLARSPDDLLHAHLKALAEHEAVYAAILAERPRLPALVQARLLEVNSGLATHLLPALGDAQSLRVERHLVFNTWLALVQYHLMNRDLFAPGRSVLADRADELVRSFLTMMR